MAIELFIQNQDTIYMPVVEDGIQLSWERKNTPGKLSFTVVKDGELNFQEGNPVKLVINDKTMFYGFVFTKKRKANSPTIDVVAYDQTRYLKNKDTFIGEGLKASEILRRLAKDFLLDVGMIEDTQYTIDSIVEENQTLFDIIQSALDETLAHTGQLYCLYDAAGKLMLQNINAMKLDILIDAQTGEDFDYESSIDTQTYNKIQLCYEDKQNGKRALYIAQDSEKIAQWGMLQYFEQIQSPIGAPAKADALLQLYDQKTRKLTVKNVFGDVRVRAGCTLMVSLHLGDIVVNNHMMVEKVTHHFTEEHHFMDLTLVGGEFIA